MQANYLHAGHDHSWAEHLLEPLEPMLPGGEKTVGFLGHLLADAGQIYLMLLVVMFAVFLYANRERAITPFDYAKINRGNGE